MIVIDPKRFALATAVGGIVLYAAGYVILTRAVADFYAANAGSATGVARGEQIVWAVAIGNLAYAALIAFTLTRRPIASIREGAIVGAIVGFLIWCTADFIIYGISNTANLTRTVVDTLLEIVHGGIGGTAIAAVLRPRVPRARPTA
jgi:hypothetical protein